MRFQQAKVARQEQLLKEAHDTIKHLKVATHDREVSIKTTAQSADIQGGGMNFQAVLKSGSNKLKGNSREVNNRVDNSRATGSNPAVNPEGTRQAANVPAVSRAALAVWPIISRVSSPRRGA